MANISLATKLANNEVTSLADDDALPILDNTGPTPGMVKISSLKSHWNSVLSFLSDTSPTLAGDLDGQSTYDLNNIVNVDVEGYVEWTEIADPGAPAANIVRLYAADEGGFSVIHHVDSNGIDLNVSRDEVHVARNTTGSTLSKGDWVYINGSSGSLPTVALADASSSDTAEVFGIVLQDIANNSNGRILQAGDIEDIDTSAFNDGDAIYLDTTAGAATATKPTGSNIVVKVGTVIKGGSVGAGVIDVNIQVITDPTLTITYTNKTIDSANNTLTLDLSEGTLAGTTAEFNTALSDGSFITSASSIGDLTDVDLTGSPSPADGDVLTYDGTSWVAEAASASGSAIVLDLGDDDANESSDLQEIATTGDTNSIFTEPTADKLLIDVGQNWPTADTANNLATDAVDAITEIAAALKSGSDATLVTGTAGTNGNLVQWNTDGDAVDSGVASANVLTDITGESIGDLSDVDLTGSPSPADGDVLTFDGTNWVPEAAAGGSPGGSDTEVQFNDGGSFGGDANFTFDKTNDTLTLGGGTITTSSKPVLDLSQTWNDAVTFTAFKLNVTDTSSNAASLLADFQTGGTSLVAIDKTGNFLFGASGIDEMRTSNNAIEFMDSGSFRVGIASAYGLLINTLRPLAWNDNATTQGTLEVHYDADDTLAQRRGANAQTNRLYATYSSTTDYHRSAWATAKQTASAVSGASVTLSGIIPDGAVLVGCTSKVTTALGTGNGTTGYQVGDGSDVDRWGEATAVTLGTVTQNSDWTATTIQAFTSAQDVVLTAVGGNFDGTGAIEVTVHYLRGEAD